MGAELSSGRHAAKHPLDWYVELGWCWDQVAAEIGVATELQDDVTVWDPACGYGTCPAQMAEWGCKVVLSDLVDNVRRADFREAPRFFSADFLTLDKAPAERVSIWTNPPFSYRTVRLDDGRDVSIAEAFVRHAMKLATHRVVVLVPNKWLASQGRYRLFAKDHPPAQVLHFTQRPSMPPGDMIEALGDRAHRGGKVDFMALVWNLREPTAPGETRTVWLPPLSEAV